MLMKPLIVRTKVKYIIIIMYHYGEWYTVGFKYFEPYQCRNVIRRLFFRQGKYAVIGLNSYCYKRLVIVRYLFKSCVSFLFFQSM